MWSCSNEEKKNCLFILPELIENDLETYMKIETSTLKPVNTLRNWTQTRGKSHI